MIIREVFIKFIRISLVIIVLWMTNNLTKDYILGLIINKCVSALLFSSFKKDKSYFKNNNIYMKINFGERFQFVYKKDNEKNIINIEYKSSI